MGDPGKLASIIDLLAEEYMLRTAEQRQIDRSALATEFARLVAAGRTEREIASALGLPLEAVRRLIETLPP